MGKKQKEFFPHFIVIFVKIWQWYSSYPLLCSDASTSSLTVGET